MREPRNTLERCLVLEQPPPPREADEPMKRLLVGAMLLAACAPAARPDPVDVYLEARLKSLHIPGASLAIVRDGRIVKARGYGVASLELGAPATEHTVYEIGSNTKMFTGAAAMLLVEEGKLGLDDPITAYFPGAPPAWSRITVRHLLTHTSGIQNHVAVPDWLRVFKTDLFYQTTPAREELLERFYRLPLEFEPGETWAYDNTGYILLGVIIEKASGKPYWDFMAERLFVPVGMIATRNTDPEPIVPNRAAGYEWTNGSFQNRPVLLPAIASSAGATLSTVEDLAKWDAALYGDKPISRAAREKMWTPARTRDGSAASFDYGFGWFIDSYHGHRFVQHSGGTPGFSSAIYRFLDDRLAVILLTNHSDRILDSLVIDVAGIVEPALRRSVAATDPDPRRTARVKAVLTGLLAGKHDAGDFTRPMLTFLETATGAALWKWFASEGELAAVSYVTRRPRPPAGWCAISSSSATTRSGSRWCSRTTDASPRFVGGERGVLETRHGSSRLEPARRHRGRDPDPAGRRQRRRRRRRGGRGARRHRADLDRAGR